MAYIQDFLNCDSMKKLAWPDFLSIEKSARSHPPHCIRPPNLGLYSITIHTYAFFSNCFYYLFDYTFRLRMAKHSHLIHSTIVLGLVTSKTKTERLLILNINSKLVVISTLSYCCKSTSGHLLHMYKCIQS